VRRETFTSSPGGPCHPTATPRGPTHEGWWQQPRCQGLLVIDRSFRPGVHSDPTVPTRAEYRKLTGFGSDRPVDSMKRSTALSSSGETVRASNRCIARYGVVSERFPPDRAECGRSLQSIQPADLIHL